MTIYDDPSMTFAGWTCQQCGMWVPAGQTHTCGNTVNNCKCFNCEILTRLDGLIHCIDKLIKTIEANQKQ